METKKPEISVLMSVYTESEEEIISSVESILYQTFSNFEIILVNDNPLSKETKNILEKIRKKDNRIRLLVNDRNRGLGYSLNKAIRNARAKILARMDTVDTSRQDRFEKQISFIRKNPKIDLLFTQWIDIDEKNKIVFRKPSHIDFANIHKSFFIRSMLMHPSLLAHKKVFLENPYPDMDRPEDIVLWLKLIRKGYKFDIIEEPLYFYNIDRLNIEQRHSKIKTYSKNLLPHLLHEIHYYWKNIYFWMYFLRIFFEYLVSRNFLFFKIFHTRATFIWKKIFGI